MLLNFIFLVASSSSSLVPHHHPQHRAPRALLDRIAASNPTSLTTNATLAARRPFSAGLRVSPLDHGADPTGRNDSWALHGLFFSFGSGVGTATAGQCAAIAATAETCPSGWVVPESARACNNFDAREALV